MFLGATAEEVGLPAGTPVPMIWSSRRRKMVPNLRAIAFIKQRLAFAEASRKRAELLRQQKEEEMRIAQAAEAEKAAAIKKAEIQKAAESSRAAQEALAAEERRLAEEAKKKFESELPVIVPTVVPLPEEVVITPTVGVGAQAAAEAEMVRKRKEQEALKAQKLRTRRAEVGMRRARSWKQEVRKTMLPAKEIPIDEIVKEKKKIVNGKKKIGMLPIAIAGIALLAITNK